MSPEQDATRSRGSVSRQITDGLVRLYRERTGRGPVSVRVILDGDAVVVLLHDVLTRAEQSLVHDGHVDEVLAFRRAFQDVLRPAFVVEIQEATGRQVETFMSTTSADPDHSAEIFLLRG
jgi:uncharacterized protein YbcI